jgi:two-component system, OmpR family, sensor kinase
VKPPPAPAGRSLAAGFGRLLVLLLALQTLLTGVAVSRWLRREEARLQRAELVEHGRFLLPALEDSLGRWAGQGPPLSRQAEIRHRMQRSLGELRSLSLSWIDTAGNAATAGFLQQSEALPALLEAVRRGATPRSIEALAAKAELPLLASQSAAGTLLLAGRPGRGLLRPESRGLLGLLLAVSALAAGLAGWLLARPLLKRFARFHEAFRALGAGRLGHRLRDGGADELGQLAAEFNGMATRIEELTGRLEDSDRRRRRLLSEVGHELGAPLTTLQGQLETLLRDTAPAAEPAAGPALPDLRRRLALALSDSRRLDRLVGDLLDLARLEDAGLGQQRRPLPLRALVEDEVAAVELACLEHGVELELELPEVDPVVLGDAGRLGQILRNLLRNALQQLIQAATPQPALRLRLEAREAEAWIEVEDNGPGIAPELLPRLFERYQRPHAPSGEGSGLGLAISHRLARLHGGALEAQSVPGQGALFRLRLPLADGAVQIRPSSGAGPLTSAGEVP